MILPVFLMGNSCDLMKLNLWFKVVQNTFLLNSKFNQINRLFVGK